MRATQRVGISPMGEEFGMKWTYKVTTTSKNRHSKGTGRAATPEPASARDPMRTSAIGKCASGSSAAKKGADMRVGVLPLSAHGRDGGRMSRQNGSRRQAADRGSSSLV